MTAQAAARHRRLIHPPNEAAEPRLNAVVLRLIGVQLRQNAEVVHQRIAGVVRVTYRVQRRNVNSRVTTAGWRRHGPNVHRGQISSGHRRNAYRVLCVPRHELNGRHRESNVLPEPSRRAVNASVVRLNVRNSNHGLTNHR